MKTLWNSAFGLLLVTGCLLGLSLPFGKLATQAGIPALVWSLVISAGGGVVLLIGLLSAGKRFRPGWKQLRYFLVVAVVSYALPNVLMFTVMPHLGAGYTGIMYTLSPIMTLALSALLGVQRPGRYGMAGIAIGFAGAVMVAASRGQAGQPAALIWVAAALLVPVSLAMGNIYRTTNWPKGAGPIELAAGSNLVAAVLLFAGVAALPGVQSIALLAQAPFLAVAQAAAASGMFAFFFRLQSVGGPVYLSQIGYVAAAVGLLCGMLLLGEHYAVLSWAGALVIALGVLLTTVAQRRGA